MSKGEQLTEKWASPIFIQTYF